MKKNDLQNIWENLECRFNDKGFVAMRSVHQDTLGQSVEGSTGFFRDAEFQTKMISELLNRSGDSPVRILVVPGSIGCEALTLSMIAHKIDPNRDVQIDTFDVSDLYTDVAELAVYPEGFVKNVPDEYSEYFEESSAGPYVGVSDAIRSRVNVLPAQSVFDFEPSEQYDLVVSMNFLMHLDVEGSKNAILKMSQFSSGMFVFNNFEELDFKKEDYKNINDFLVSSRSFSLLDKHFNAVSSGEKRALPEYASFVNVKDSFIDDEPVQYHWNSGSALDCIIAMSCDS